MDVDPMEILDELSRTAPLELERAALRVANRKLSARVAELEHQEKDTDEEISTQAEHTENPGIGPYPFDPRGDG